MIHNHRAIGLAPATFTDNRGAIFRSTGLASFDATGRRVTHYTRASAGAVDRNAQADGVNVLADKARALGLGKRPDPDKVSDPVFAFRALVARGA